MFRRVLVANRGEIAVRVIRALHENDVEAVAVYSTADRDSLHVRLADRAVCIGPPQATESYLRVPSLVAAATTTGCEAVHPGWGFLAENPAFVEACADNDLVFIGPSAETMARMGDKVQAKAEMRAAEVPVVPGTEGATTLEESPSPALTPDTREEMEAAAERASEKIGYRNAGTFEFLLGPDGSFYFIELNARLQVEHPVTELCTGIDLVREQLRVAADENLSATGRAQRRGHAIEIRLNAEDPEHDFRPSPGLISVFE